MKKYIVYLLCIYSFGIYTINIKSCEAATDYYKIIYSEVSAYDGNYQEADWITNAIIYASATYSIDPFLLTSILEVESGFNLSAQSSAGAIGIAQLMPGTAAGLGYDPYDPLQNILGGANYLKLQLDNFSGYGEYGVTYAVAAYNAGPAAIKKYSGVPPYQETINYVYSVSANFNRLNSYRG